ncbi:MAG: sigma-70 family RNA polymerase sigma factor [Anaplasmataceae bacterium]|nr:sigma-70 family RNA polymerase sigma factor [Anaplasmataceae bacterium]
MGLFADSFGRNFESIPSLSMLDGEDNIIKEAIKGEASAFGRLYDHYQPQIYRFILIRVGHREEAEDLTHQVFLNAWKRVPSYEPRGFPFSSWLYRIARNLIIDFYRTKKTEISVDEINEEDLGVNNSLGESADKKIEIENLLYAIRRLKDEHQEVIILRFIEDYSIAETASALNRSQGAIKLLQHRAINNLKKILKQ